MQSDCLLYTLYNVQVEGRVYSLQHFELFPFLMILRRITYSVGAASQ